MLDELFFRLLLNRDVLTVLIKVVGVDAQGNEQSGIFDANLKRMMDLRGTTPKRTVDVRLKEARAAMALLHLYENEAIDDAVVLVDSNTAFIRKFGAERLRRHAEPGAAQPHHWPDSLQPMMRKLAHAGTRSFEREAEGFYTLDLRTDRCDCPWSHYYGVTSAHGKCKHAVLKDFVVELKRSRAGRLRVLDHARSALWHQVHERERSKPASMRCMPLHLMRQRTRARCSRCCSRRASSLYRRRARALVSTSSQAAASSSSALAPSSSSAPSTQR